MKKVVVGICVCIIALMIFMITSQTSSQSMPKTQPKKPNLEPKKEIVLQEKDDIKKIKELKQSVKAKQTSKLYLVSCAPCHGDDARGVIAPSIAGKSKDEILARLKDYKAGKYPNTLMAGVLQNINDVNLSALAGEISELKK
ncbi:c-type cytochrome [Campylobacter geochelonis]|uniref:Flavocytochrome c cytochrome subunit n=1 Tax=Campylobacter geochelonis TaxID=1780362 RepID=A0A128EC83_9BACT|nr:hypothetical protein [Campylobacter geochelonis]QKF72162.1 monoheme c-type cytochrome [Campylobacter geochelonis]CZE46023.1 Flavocytochrome c cytochrome subunit [Campylobacter geochelonis]CZE46604.1 Flavocytochrome c cytochrome subunit [Campylobacter geochelonis]CZE49754.1 Flavocytochrome c cytochrome subunit [Campylobacter geochelonis]